MTPLQALKRIRQETCPATICPDFDKEECCKIIEDSLQALEIIKNKMVNVELVYGCMVAYPQEKTPIHYNETIDKRYKKYMLTQDDYDLLWRVLK